LVTTQGQQARPGGGQFVAGEIIVKFRPATTAVQRNAIVTGRAAGLIRRFEALGVNHIRLRAGQSVETAVAEFRALPEVVFAQPNYIRRMAVNPNDPWWQIGFIWGPVKIQAPEVWNSYTTGDPGIIVANLDTGVDYTHPDLAPNMWHNPDEIPGNGVDDDDNGYVDDVYGIDAVNGDSNPMDDQGHGTLTAGIMGAVGNNGVGGVGVTWNTKILACKFITSAGTGTDADAIECFNYIVALKQRGINIRISNNSYGAAREDPPAFALKDAIDAAGVAGILNVFAAGNDGTDNDVIPFDPAGFASPSIISVAASDDSDQRPGFSNYGATSVHLAAPGDFIFGPALGGSYTFSSGTSMAAPMVSGAAALLLANDSTLTVDQLKARIITSVDVLPQWSGVVSSGGRLNVLNAIALGGNSPPSVTLTSPTPGSSFFAPATISLEASASDSDGSVEKVDFYANGVLIGSDLAAPYTAAWSNMPLGSYQLTAVATDDGGATRSSDPVGISVVTPPWRVNVALPVNGGSAVGSTTLNSGFPAGAAVNGDRKGLGWSNGGGWNDGTLNVWPDWLEVRFNGLQTIDEIDVFTVQDNYAAPAEPTPAMTFSLYGNTDFAVEYWTGSTWQAVPGAVVTGNTLVWRQFTFSAITTSKIRVFVTQGVDRYSRITEVEAYTSTVGPNNPPSVTMTSPAAGSSFFAPATVTLEASASDSNGSISRVDFYAGSLLVGTDTTSPYAASWSNIPPGNFVLTAVATDNLGATTVSSPVTITVTTPPWRVNVALPVNGGSAVGSSTLSSGFPASAVINGDRKGVGWGQGGGWNDGTLNLWPDWVEVRFNGLQTIDEVDVVTLQDTYSTPADPTPGMTFSLYGIRDFSVEYWTGSTWQTIPGASVTGNTLVWRQFSFSAITTSKIRVFVTQGVDRYSRITEVEAYTSSVGANSPPSVTLTSPAANTSFTTPANVQIDATATDTNGTVAKVDFYAGGSLVGTDTTSPFSTTWVNVPAGNYILSAIATDNLGATATSNPVSITVTTPPGRINVALPVNGGSAVGSSTLNSGFPASATINGDRKGIGWSQGGGWNDGTLNVWPDWLEVRFNGQKTIDEIDVFTLQDNYSAPIDPTPTLTFTKYGLRDFTLEYWTGTAWQPIPGASVSGNNLVWRQFVFTPITTSKIRLFITQATDRYSRVTEVEVYTTPGGG
jgi:subtilisin family serine protease